MEENILTWNIPNWITVVLMVAIGFSLVAMAGNFIRQKRSEKGG